jgi:GT2 family glycosyltransferase
MDKISILIPTYNSLDSLDLLLTSIFEGVSNEDNIQVVVGVDGTHDINKPILSKYKNRIETLIMEENVGLCRLTNLLVYNATNELILILNDDNVVGKYFDLSLLKHLPDNSVISPNQIEPFPSMFKQFEIWDAGRDPKTFNLENFCDGEHNISENRIDETGSTLPIFMNKTDFLRVGGWDETYPQGLVADWDFFLKCQLSGMKMLRTYNCHIYHFVSLSTNKTEEQKEKRRKDEIFGHEFAKYKWGYWIQHDENTNLKYL